ncbi:MULTISPECIES: phage holin family protein [Aeromonas]|uniref:phage holin family protein n=1 Tax=Aeromonas TaxID=642 RepID=UPI00195F981D|nr:MULTISPECIES: phage holin family protein [Aeromonas]
MDASGGDQLHQAGSWITRMVGPNGGYLWMVALAIWGGTVSYLSRLKQSPALSFSLAELAGEWAISGFAGLLMAYLCTEMNMSWYMTAVATGITGHMGGRGLFMIELWIKRRLGMSDEGRPQ